MRSIQKAKPNTKANATNDIKPALPSMNLRFKDWWIPVSCAVGVLTVAVSATPVSFSASSESVSAVAAVAALTGACAETMIEQEKESIVMIENNAINFFIFLKPVVVSFL